MAGFDMKDYVPVNERVAAFYTEHPEGSIQSEIVELTASRVTVKAYAYRTADDQRPGIGHSSLEIPGSTPYTKGSEIENCETSAWGRAIAALGFEVKRGIASQDEVRNKQSEQRGGSPSSPRATPAPTEQQLRNDALALAVERYGKAAPAEMQRLADEFGVPKGERATVAQLRAIIARIETPGPTATAHAEAPATDTPANGSSTPVPPATAQAPVVPPDGEPAPAPTDEQILDVTGGEFVKPRTVEEAIADAESKAKKSKAKVTA